VEKWYKIYLGVFATAIGCGIAALIVGSESAAFWPLMGVLLLGVLAMFVISVKHF
jgi:hypothetical protein